MSLLKIKNLKRYFDVGPGRQLHAVDGVDLEINENEVLGLIGESGCGKSTLGRTIVGLLEKTLGEISYRGEKLPDKYSAQDFRKFSREIQMIFQDPFASLNPRMTVKEIVAEGPMLHKMWKPNEINEKVGRWLINVGLNPDQMSRYPHEFSGGQRQRIGLARALALEPKVLICDEPISALDVSIQAQIINLLADLRVKMELTILFIAHDLSMVRYISDKMAVMYLGKIVEIGDADSLFFEPLHPYSKLLMSSNPIADPKIEKTRTTPPIRGEIPTPINVAPGCRFASRCPQAHEKCISQTPNLKEVRPNHSVACHLY